MPLSAYATPIPSLSTPRPYCVYLLQTLAAVIKYCHDFNVLWEGALLKPNMVLPGSDSGVKASPQDVAHYTVTVLARTVPAALPGIMVRLLMLESGSVTMLSWVHYSSCPVVRARRRPP